MTETEKAIIDFCGHHADWWPSTTQVQEMLALAQPAQEPQRKPLTEQEIGAILEDVNAYGTRLYTFARAIEAAHGIKGEA